MNLFEEINRINAVHCENIGLPVPACYREIEIPISIKSVPESLRGWPFVRLPDELTVDMVEK